MSVHIEDLHVGDWITGTEDRRDLSGFFGHRPMQFDGMPWKVKAISAPFIACERDGVLITINIRDVGITKLSQPYVRALRAVEIKGEAPKRKKKRKAKRDPRDCPRCGQRMVQRIPSGEVKRLWHRICPDCGYDQGPVEQGAMP